MAKKTKAAAADAAADAPAPTPRLLELYKNTVLPELSKQLGRTNPMDLPKIQKVVINMGVGAATTEKKYLDEAVGAMTQIAGQKPLITKSRIAVAGFKLRENLPIGCKVTLRGSADVRIPGPVVQPGVAARARLSRAESRCL